MTTTTPRGTQLIDALRAGLPADAVRAEEADLAAFTRDAAPFSPAGNPAVLVQPSTAEQVRHVLRTAHHLGVPVVPQGARTGLAGGANAVDGCVLLSLLRMDRILEIDPPNRLVRCEPGVRTAELSRACAEHGLFYPPDPASWETCTVGGNIATAAGGVCCVKYGVTADYVRGLTVVLADGALARLGRRTVKGVAGYDLTRLFVGSEGTLGVIVEATLALRTQPPPSHALVALFNTTGAAGQAVVDIVVSSGQAPSALELLDRETSRAVALLGHPALAGNSAPAGNSAVGPGEGPAATLIAACDGTDPASEISAIAGFCERAGATRVIVAADPEEAATLLEARRMVLPAMRAQMAAMPGRPTGFIEDVAVPITRLTTLIDQIQRIASDHGVYISTLGHAGDGNLHPTVIFDQDDADAVARAQAAYDAVMAAGLELGGTITGEHGIGLLKRDWLARELDPVALRLHHDIKNLLDPRGILNPGKVFSGE